MKTTILSITNTDDVYSIQDKLTWNKSGRVLLKLEGDNMLFLSRKELALLVRFSKNLGSQLGVISPSRAIRVSAQRNGIPVFRSLREAQQKGWQQTTQNPLEMDDKRRISQLKKIQQFTHPSRSTMPFFLRFGAFLMAVFAVLSLVVFFIPSAEVDIRTKKMTQQIEIPIQAKTSLSKIDLSGTLPIQVHQLELILGEQIPCTGSVDVAISRASGDLSIQNLTGNEITIPLGTIFSSSTAPELRFESTQSGKLPAGVNETIRLSVKAIEPGIVSNLLAGQIDAVEGDLGLFISVTNPEALSGGENSISRSPSQVDLSRLRSRIAAKFLTEANEKFLAQASNEEIFIPGSARLIEIVEETYDPNIGLPSEILRISQKVTLEGWYIREADLEQVLKTMLTIQLAENQEVLSQELRTKALQQPIIENDQVEWLYQAEWDTIQRVAIQDLRRNLVGKDLEQIPDILDSFDLSEDQVSLTLFPRWWKRMPFLDSRIEVSVHEQ
jgi:hypothetical protein